MFQGSLSAPESIPGPYSGFDFPCSPPNQASLTICTPEPSALLLLFSGFLALVGALALKKVRV